MKMMTSIILTCLLTTLLYEKLVSAIDFQVMPREDTPGIYFDDQGEVSLYSSEWKLVTYVDTSKLNELYTIVRKNIAKTQNLCEKLESGSKLACHQDILLMNSQLKRTQELREIVRKSVKQTVVSGEGNSRRKRGLINMIGSVAKSLFGVMDQSDYDYYQNKISELETEQMSMLKVAKEQMTVVKSTILGVNRTLYEVTENEDRMAESFNKLQLLVSNQTKGIKAELGRVEIQVAINHHLVELESLIFQLQDQLNVLVTALMNAQSGVIQLQILSPDEIVKAFKKIQNDIPRDLTLPFELKVSHENQFMKVSKVNVFFANEKLIYVIKTPLIETKRFNLYKQVPFPTRIRNNPNHFVFILEKKQYLIIDNERQTYVSLDTEQLEECKKVDDRWTLCQADFALNLAHTHTSCVVSLLAGVSQTPETCEKAIISISHLTWINVRKNLYIYIAPEETKLTCVCKDTDSDVTIKGTGLLKLWQPCTVYSLNSKIYGVSEVNSTSKKDIVPDALLHFDCCEEVIPSLKLANIPELSRIGLKNVLTHTDDLAYASKKVSEVEKLVREQEEEMKQRKKDSYFNLTQCLSWVIIIVILIVLFCLCKCCRVAFSKFCKRAFDDKAGCCASICFKQTIVTQNSKSKNSDESLTVYMRRPIRSTLAGRRPSQSRSRENSDGELEVSTTSLKASPTLSQKQVM